MYQVTMPLVCHFCYLIPSNYRHHYVLQTYERDTRDNFCRPKCLSLYVTHQRTFLLNEIVEQYENYNPFIFSQFQYGIAMVHYLT